VGDSREHEKRCESNIIFGYYEYHLGYRGLGERIILKWILKI
jgi:hypothetical protein